MKLPSGPNPFKRISREVVYERPYVRFIKDIAEIDGKEYDRSYADIADGIAIVAINEKNEVALVGQWRYPIEKYTWEVPAGMQDGNEELEQTAKRELEEEAGVLAKSWTYLGGFYMEASSTNKMGHAFLAKDLELTQQSTEDDEQIEVLWLPYEEALKKVAAGEIQDGLTILGLLRAQAYLQN